MGGVLINKEGIKDSITQKVRVLGRVNCGAIVRYQYKMYPLWQIWLIKKLRILKSY